MAFLTKKESAMITNINASQKLSKTAKNDAISKIKYNAQLRSDRYRRPVKVFLSIISSIRNKEIAADLLL